MDTPAPLAPQIAAFRRFNRMYTRFIGVLEEDLLHSDFSLAEARILYELGTRGTTTAKEIMQALGLDAAYLSRILAKFEANSLLRRKTSKLDARSTNLNLTARGKAEFKKIDGLSNQQAQGVLEKLSAFDQSKLITAMGSIEAALASARQTQPTFTLRPHRVGDMGWIVHREVLYAEHYGWDETFEVTAARIVADFLTHFKPGRERCWIAEIEGRNAGHILLVEHPDDPTVARLRLLTVEPEARGAGVGSALVEACVDFARSVGYRKITLWTQSVLTGARRIYQRAGFQLVEEKSHHNFGKNLIWQTWELDLQPAVSKSRKL